MARDKGALVNIDNSAPLDFPNGRIKNNTGVGDGTPVNELVYGDLHEAFAKMMRLYGINYNGLPDNETNEYQLVEAIKSLASKNDYTLPLNTSAGTLTVPLKINKLQSGETFILKATVDKTTETQIKGTLDGVTKVITYIGDFKAGDYVRMISLPAEIVLVRLFDSNNLDLVVSGFNYLKKASSIETIAGIIDTKAVTPLSFFNAFLDYVNGAGSTDFLADAVTNGLYPASHFAIVAGLGASPIKNVGWLSGLDVHDTSGSLPVGGNITSAVATVLPGDASRILVTMQNAMDNTNYLVKTYIQSMSSSTAFDDNTYYPVFKPVNTTQFQLGVCQGFEENQNLKIHIEVQQLY